MSLAEAETETRSDIGAQMRAVGRAARAAARRLARATTAEKNKALMAMATALRDRAAAILADNALDVADAKDAKLAGSFLDRLTLTPERVEAMARGIEEIAELPDPVGTVLAAWDRPNGLHIERVRTPLGVIGIIYESRPNVTADAGALCLKAGNAAILRGGSDSFRSSTEIHACLVAGLEAAGLPAEAIQFVPTRDRAAVGLMLSGLDGAVDVIVPRGGKSLVGRVQMEARVPVFAHLEGVCHVYVDREADLEMAKKIVVNAKMRRTGVCGAAETLLVDAKVADSFLKPLIEALQAAGCRVRGDERSRHVVPGVTPAVESDWTTEYLDAVIAVKVVDGIKEAIEHIETYGTHHTDSIVTNDKRAAQRFMAEVDSAIVLHNAS
ncbi:MAG: glutamate-5-semialdehyde dehydrogenase, partial [Bauldia sp.]|nr:glutamate-5-semialdehyde dehydrogenase [Bauldia sp.]